MVLVSMGGRAAVVSAYLSGLHHLQDFLQEVAMKPGFLSHSPSRAHFSQRSGCIVQGSGSGSSNQSNNSSSGSGKQDIYVSAWRSCQHSYYADPHQTMSGSPRLC